MARPDLPDMPDNASREMRRGMLAGGSYRRGRGGGSASARRVTALGEVVEPRRRGVQGGPVLAWVRPGLSRDTSVLVARDGIGSELNGDVGRQADATRQCRRPRGAASVAEGRSPG